MSANFHNPSQVPKPIPQNSSAQQQQQQQQPPITDSSNGLSSVTTTKPYPSATAKYEQLVQSSELFWEKLKEFHNSFGTKFTKPTVGGKVLDLHRHFVEVTTRGGFEKVIRDRKWKEVVMVFNFPSTITSASFVLRKFYLSLLYHFEQVYYFHKQYASLAFNDPLSRNLVNGSGTLGGSVSRNHLPDQKNLELQLGCSVTGAIDGKFDNGYLVTVNLGSDKLKGLLYHIPQQASQASHSSNVYTRRCRKRSKLALRDPFRPKSNRSGYNFLFAEHYTGLKPMYYGEERAISKRIGHTWNNLTEAEKQVQDKGVMENERYRNEMSEYKSSYNSTHQ